MTKEEMTFEIYKELVGATAFNTRIKVSMQDLLKLAEGYADYFAFCQEEKGKKNAQ